ncbi:MAG: hypothetical protein ACSW8C_04815 [bacterium]
MALRSVISAVVFLLVFANFSKAHLNVYPERCDNEEVCEYLKEYFGKPSEDPLEKYSSDFEISKFITDNQHSRLDLLERGSDFIVKDKIHILSQKLIAILYLCKIAGEYTHPDDDMRYRRVLEQAILCKLKIFQDPGYRKILIVDPLNHLLFSLWGKFCSNEIVSIKFRKEDIHHTASIEILRGLFVSLWEDVRGGKLPDSYRDDCNKLTTDQLQKSIPILWEFGDFGDAVCLVLRKNDLKFYYSLPPRVLEDLISIVNSTVDDAFLEKFSFWSHL